MPNYYKRIRNTNIVSNIAFQILARFRRVQQCHTRILFGGAKDLCRFIDESLLRAGGASPCTKLREF